MTWYVYKGIRDMSKDITLPFTHNSYCNIYIIIDVKWTSIMCIFTLILYLYCRYRNTVSSPSAAIYSDTVCDGVMCSVSSGGRSSYHTSSCVLS